MSSGWGHATSGPQAATSWEPPTASAAIRVVRSRSDSLRAGGRKICQTPSRAQAVKPVECPAAAVDMDPLALAVRGDVCSERVELVATGQREEGRSGVGGEEAWTRQEHYVPISMSAQSDVIQRSKYGEQNTPSFR